MARSSDSRPRTRRSCLHLLDIPRPARDGRAGLEFKWIAYELCLQVLRTPGMLGKQIHGMIDERDNTLFETWAFLCPHPLQLKIPLYVKIALHGGRLHLVMISMHTDHSGKLLQAIRAYLKNKP